MTPPPNRRGARLPEGISDDFPVESNDPGQRSSAPSFAFQAIMEMQKSIGILGEKIDRLTKDRDEDRKSYKDDIKEIKTDLGKSSDEAKSEFKEFRKEDFKKLSDDVQGLKLKWAKVTGVGAVVGVLSTVLIELIKKYMGG